MSQLTFEDLSVVQFIKRLTPTQINIIRFLEQRHYQADIARRLGISKQYVHQVVRKLEQYNLIEAERFSYYTDIWRTGRKTTVALADPFHGRATTYRISERLQNLLAVRPFQSGNYTLCTPHHIKVKYPILEHSSEEFSFCTSRHSRLKSIYVKSWQPRGPERHLWHVATQNGNIGIESHGSSIVAYRVEKDPVLAASVEDATHMIAAAIQEGVGMWQAEQGELGSPLKLGSPQLITKPHYAFPSKKVHEMNKRGEVIHTEGFFHDDSPHSDGEDGIGHVETLNGALADEFDRRLRGLTDTEQIIDQKVNLAVPKIAQEVVAMLDPQFQQVNAVMAYIQSGEPLQNQFNQMVGLMVKMLDRTNELEREVRTLRGPAPVDAPKRDPAVSEEEMFRKKWNLPSRKPRGAI